MNDDDVRTCFVERVRHRLTVHRFVVDRPFIRHERAWKTIYSVRHLLCIELHVFQLSFDAQYMTSTVHVHVSTGHHHFTSA